MTKLSAQQSLRFTHDRHNQNTASRCLYRPCTPYKMMLISIRYTICMLPGIFSIVMRRCVRACARDSLLGVRAALALCCSPRIKSACSWKIHYVTITLENFYSTYYTRGDVCVLCVYYCTQRCVGRAMMASVYRLRARAPRVSEVVSGCPVVSRE